MKSIIALTAVTLMSLPGAQASECFVTNTCLKKVSNCRLVGKPSYSPVTGVLFRTSGLSYEWKESIECLGPRGRLIKTSQSGNEVSNAHGRFLIEELRIPENLESVHSEDIMKVNELALSSCEENKETLTTTYNFCE